MPAAPVAPTMTGDARLLAEVHDAVRDRSRLAAPTVERLTVGDRLLLVEATDGGRTVAGVAHRPPGAVTADPEGAPAFDCARWAFDPPAVAAGGGDAAAGSAARPLRAVGLAALNALSAPLVEWVRGDPMAALDPAVGTVATVGLFGPAFRKFGRVEVRVVEREPVDPPDVPADVSVFAPGERDAAFAGADVVFLTGSSLVYGGTDAYLTAARRAGVPTVVLVGGTASFLPGPAFDAGVTMQAGARVADRRSVRRGVREGACGTDLHDRGLEKVYATAGDPAGLTLGQ